MASVLRLQTAAGLRFYVYKHLLDFFMSTNTRYVYNNQLIFMITSTGMSSSLNYVYKHDFGFSFTSTNTSLTPILCPRTRVTSTGMSLTSLLRLHTPVTSTHTRLTSLLRLQTHITSTEMGLSVNYDYEHLLDFTFTPTNTRYIHSNGFVFTIPSTKTSLTPVLRLHPPV